MAGKQSKKQKESAKLLTDINKKETAHLGTVIAYNDRLTLIDYKVRLIEHLKNMQDLHLKKNTRNLKRILDEILNIDIFLSNQLEKEAEIYYLKYLK